MKAMERFLNSLVLTVAAAAVTGLAACAPDRVMFVTNTNVGIGYDAASTTGHVGYSRQEAYIGPDYPNEGVLPPVAASLQSSLDWFAPSVSQYYATGNAALIGTGRIVAPSPIDPTVPGAITQNNACALNRGCPAAERRLSIIGTNTHLGLVVKTQSTAVSSLDFGYGRQEVSLLPLQKDGSTNGDIYPSAYASITVDTNRGSTSPVTGLAVSQFFATGASADALAANSRVRDSFNGLASASATAAQQQSALSKSVNLTDADLTSQEAQGGANASAVQQSVKTATAKLLGRNTSDSDTLTPTDISKIQGSLSSLPGVDANAYALPKTVTTAGGFRTWIVQYGPAQAFVQQQS